MRPSRDAFLFRTGKHVAAPLIVVTEWEVQCSISEGLVTISLARSPFSGEDEPLDNTT
jgi:hypothetical protein